MSRVDDTDFVCLTQDNVLFDSSSDHIRISGGFEIKPRDLHIVSSPVSTKDGDVREFGRLCIAVRKRNVSTHVNVTFSSRQQIYSVKGQWSSLPLVHAFNEHGWPVLRDLLTDTPNIRPLRTPLRIQEIIWRCRPTNDNAPAISDILDSFEPTSLHHCVLCREILTITSQDQTIPRFRYLKYWFHCLRSLIRIPMPLLNHSEKRNTSSSMSRQPYHGLPLLSDL